MAATSEGRPKPKPRRSLLSSPLKKKNSSTNDDRKTGFIALLRSSKSISSPNTKSSPKKTSPLKGVTSNYRRSKNKIIPTRDTLDDLQKTDSDTKKVMDEPANAGPETLSENNASHDTEPHDDESTFIETFRCACCQLDFSSPWKRQNHVEFSTLHELNVKKQILSTHASSMIENECFYRGCKFLAQDGIQLEVFMYNQRILSLPHDAGQIAIIGYNIDRQEPYVPLFVSLESVQKLQALDETKTDTLNLDFISSTFSLPELSTVGSFVMSHLDVALEAGLTLGEPLVQLDDPMIFPGKTLPDRENQLSQLERRNIVAEAFGQLEQRLEADQDELSKASLEAKIKAEHTRTLMEKFRQDF